MTTYRVTYQCADNTRSILEGPRTSHQEVEEFTNIDHGYDRVEYLRKRWWASDVQWEHVQ